MTPTTLTLLLLPLGAGGRATPLPQHVHGRVLGYDGRPAARVILNGLTSSGTFVVDVRTDADGRYSCPTRGGVARVAAWLEAGRLERDVSEALDGRLDFDFQRGPHFTIRGRLTGLDGRPAAGVRIRAADAEGRHVGHVATGPDGRYRLRGNRAVDHLVVDPRALRLVVAGPFDQDRPRDVDFRHHPFFGLTGRAVDERGHPVVGARVVAVGADGRHVTSVSTDGQGRYRLAVPGPVQTVLLEAAEVSLRREGPFTSARHGLDFDFRAMGIVVVEGRVVGSGGAPVEGARILRGTGRRLHRTELTRTDAGGRFRCRVPEGTAGVCAPVGGELLVAEGPFLRDTQVVLRP